MHSNTQVHILTKTEIKQAHDFFIDFWKPEKRRGRPAKLSPPDIATITLIQKHYQIKTLKSLYNLLQLQYSSIFTDLPAYQNFVIAMNKHSQFLLSLVLIAIEAGKQYRSSIKFIDSTPLPVCKVYRSSRHKTMKLLASKKKSTKGWFYGLKLHLICDQDYNLDTIQFTTGSLDDREVLDNFREQIRTQEYNSKYPTYPMSNITLVADAGYVSKEEDIKFYRSGTHLLTACRKNMKTLATLYQEQFMNMRPTVETVFSILKGRYQIITSIARSINGYLAHYIRSIFAYVFDKLGEYLLIS